MNFASDNVTPVAPEIMAAIAAANEHAAPPYGQDAVTQTLEVQLAELFETEVTVFPVATGSAANALALSVMCPPYGSIYCHEEAHIHVDECGAPELFTGGAKLIPLSGDHGKLTAEALELALQSGGAGVVHHVQPAAISLTQASEAGTVYFPDEIRAIATVAQAHRLKLHMDGARFANAIARLGCSPADATWKAGVDALCFGATKNGAMAAEAVIFFDPTLAKSFAYRRKRGGHLFSKMRYLSAQLLAYITDDLWLRNARHANQMAAQLATGLAAISGVTLRHPVEANELFVEIPEPIIADLLAAGFQFYRWEGDTSSLVRLVTAFNTPPEEVAAFLQIVRDRSKTLASV